jgi:hypothetical protein
MVLRESEIWGLKSGIFAWAVVVCVSATAHAQQRPLVTEDPETIGINRVLVEGGISVEKGQEIPVHGITGDISRFGVFGVSIGISPSAEIQVDGGLIQRLDVTERLTPPILNPIANPLIVGDHLSGVEDLIIATKIRLASEGTSRPALGLRFGTKLPTASAENGLGLGTTDFFASFLVAKTVESVRAVGNVGLIVLGNPVTGGDQSTAVGFGMSVARAVTNEFEVVGELNGRLTPFEKVVPVGLESRGVLRLAGRYTYAMLRLDFGVLVGITSRDPGFGISAGATYVITR